MNLQMLGQSRSGARQSLLEQQRVLVHETEGNELGKAAGLLLNFAEQQIVD